MYAANEWGIPIKDAIEMFDSYETYSRRNDSHQLPYDIWSLGRIK